MFDGGGRASSFSRWPTGEVVCGWITSLRPIYNRPSATATILCFTQSPI